ncbi:MAG TPA: alpha/beta fold hydrolase [Candidatus Dormibacteraeota bacterium]
MALTRRQFIGTAGRAAVGITALGVASCQPASSSKVQATHSPSPSPTPTPSATPPPVPLAIAAMRAKSYPGSPLTVIQPLAPGNNYSQSIATYKSDGLTIRGLLTIPSGTAPLSGWPVIIFNHGFIPPAQYRTTERYVAYVDAIARRGYIVFKSDYRGHGSSEGPPSSAYGTPDYTVDVLNALTTLQHFNQADANRIGFWGHSMGGHITLRSLVVSHDIRVAAIWGGVVAPYRDLLNWHPPPADSSPPALNRSWRQDFLSRFGTPDQNPAFWDSISPNTFLNDVTAPVQLHHSTTDEDVPVAFSQTLRQELTAVGKPVELFTYPGDNHNISSNFNTAMSRSIAFFDRALKA